MSVTKKSIALAVGGAFALSLGTAAIAATDNPFEIKTLSSGYQVAENHAEKGADGKCGEGKCGAEKEKAKDGKCGEGKCGAEKGAKAKDGKCGEGKCGAEKGAEKAKDGKCGEGKCGK
jgi:uncharacterized low-complexity protein